MMRPHLRLVPEIAEGSRDFPDLLQPDAVTVRRCHHRRAANLHGRPWLHLEGEDCCAVIAEPFNDDGFSGHQRWTFTTPEHNEKRQQLNHNIPKRCVSEVLDHMDQAGRRRLTLSVVIAKSLPLPVTWHAQDFGVTDNIDEIVMRVIVAKCAILRRNLYRKSAHKKMLDHEMMLRLLLDGNHLRARVSLVFHSYCFAGAGLNSIPIRGISWSPTLVSPWAGGPPSNIMSPAFWFMSMPPLPGGPVCACMSVTTTTR